MKQPSSKHLLWECLLPIAEEILLIFLATDIQVQMPFCPPVLPPWRTSGPHTLPLSPGTVISQFVFRVCMFGSVFAHSALEAGSLPVFCVLEHCAVMVESTGNLSPTSPGPAAGWKSAWIWASHTPFMSPLENLDMVISRWFPNSSLWSSWGLMLNLFAFGLLTLAGDLHKLRYTHCSSNCHVILTFALLFPPPLVYCVSPTDILFIFVLVALGPVSQFICS